MYMIFFFNYIVIILLKYLHIKFNNYFSNEHIQEMHEPNQNMNLLNKIETRFIHVWRNLSLWGFDLWIQKSFPGLCKIDLIMDCGLFS